MKILASCSLEESLKYTGKLSIPNEDKKSPDKVVLNVEVNYFHANSFDFSKLPGCIESVTFVGGIIQSGLSIPDKYKGRVFQSVTLEQYSKCNSEASGNMEIPLLVVLPDGYCDMRYLAGECEKNKSVRFIGGNLLGIDSVRIGRYDEGKEKMSPVFCGIYDTFMEARLDELEGLCEIVKQNRKKLEGVKESSNFKMGKSASKKSSTKSVKKSNSFTKFFTPGSSSF